MKKKLTYRLLYGTVFALSLLPFRVLFILSDFFFLLVYHVAGYRRKIVQKNLASSFPEKSEAEIKQIEKRFYHWLCDYVVETLKLLTISDKKLLKHIEFRGLDEVEKVFDEGRDCAGILGHYCNWEWLSASILALKRYPQAMTGLIYHPLYNEAFNQLFIDIRSAHGGDCIPKKDILRYLVKNKREGRHSLFGYISDQAPRWMNIHLWLEFLHHNTPVFTGGERIMHKMDDAVFYIDMERPRRGYYICTYKKMSDHAAQEEENAITRRFYLMLEETIRREPAYYLWTHNRWKRTKEEFDRLYDLVDGRTIPKDANVTGS